MQQDLKNSEIELSISVNSFKNPELLKLCLDSIKKNVLDVDHEIIVADSETDEDTEIMMREEYPEIKFFPHKKNVGFQNLLKKGIEASRGKYLFFLNGDILVTKNSIKKLLDFIKGNPKVGMVGPKLLNFNGTFQYSCFHFYEPITVFYRRTFLKNFGFAKKHLDWFLMKERDHGKLIEADWIMGSAMLTSRVAIQKVGLMDSRFFMYMEDVDWCRRFWEKGYKVVFYPFSEMYHYHGKASGKGSFFYSIFFNKLTWIHIFSAIKYFIKYKGKPIPQHD